MSLFQAVCNIKLSGSGNDADFRAVRDCFYSIAEACQLLDEIERALVEALRVQQK
jgi:hypothetical protein